MEARLRLRSAYSALDAMGAAGFAERARSELAATGETVRGRTAEARDALTPQEAQIARMATEGYANTEIATQLFLTGRTVDWHLDKVYAKLGVGSRDELAQALGDPEPVSA